jgi:hypothetical protein
MTANKNSKRQRVALPSFLMSSFRGEHLDYADGAEDGKAAGISRVHGKVTK